MDPRMTHYARTLASKTCCAILVSPRKTPGGQNDGISAQEKRVAADA